MSSAPIPDLYEPVPPIPALRVDVWSAATPGDLWRRCRDLLARGDDWGRAVAVGYYLRRIAVDPEALATVPAELLPPDAAQIRLYALALTTAQVEHLTRLALCRVEDALRAEDDGRPDDADAIRAEVRSARALLAAAGVSDRLDSVCAY